VSHVLALLSFAILLLAGAIELWWGSSARLRQRRSAAHVEAQLATGPSSPVATVKASTARGLETRPTDALLLRADLPTGLRVPVLVAAPCMALALAGWWRLHSAWAMPMVLGLLGCMVWLWLRSRIEQHRRKLLRQLPDFLDGMVRLTSIGNSLPMAFQSTAATMQPPLRTVLDRTLRSMRAGHDLDRALQLASRPYHLHEFELLHVVLGTGMRIGGRADQILQRMSDFMRDLAQARQELQATTSETRLSAWVLGLLPVAVAVGMTMFNPTFFKPMFTEPLGHRLLLIALALELTGGFVLYRMTKSL